MEPSDFAALTRGVAARTPGAAVVGLLEGGYDPPRLALAASAHVRALAGEAP